MITITDIVSVEIVSWFDDILCAEDIIATYRVKGREGLWIIDDGMGE